MSGPAAADSRGPGPASPESIAALRSVFPAFNELVRTGGDVAQFVADYWHPQAEYRPIEDRDWFRDPASITGALIRWIETWEVGKYRIEPDDIRELGNDRFLVTARNRGVGRRSGVPVEAVTYEAVVMRDGKVALFDEYSDREGALAALGEEVPPTRGPDRGVGAADRLWTTAEAALAALVRRSTDRRVERLFGSPPVLRAMFKRMEQLFDPQKAEGFTGEIQFELLASGGVQRWVVRLDRDRAVAAPGEAREPAITFRMPLALFVRLAVRQLHPVKAFRAGMEIRGDAEGAARFGVMFGLSR